MKNKKKMIKFLLYIISKNCIATVLKITTNHTKQAGHPDRINTQLKTYNFHSGKSTRNAQCS